MFLFVMLISSNVNDFPPSDTVALSSDDLKVGFGTCIGFHCYIVSS